MTNPNRPVTEDDVRLPEFRGMRLDNLEFREDGKVVRKDRWMMGIRSIAVTLGMSTRDGFEIDDIIARIDKLLESHPGKPASEGDISDACLHHSYSDAPDISTYDRTIWRECEKFHGIGSGDEL